MKQGIQVADLGGSGALWVRWTTVKTVASERKLSIQFEESSDTYSIFVFDGPRAFACVVYKGEVPPGDYSQAQNDADKADFETNYKSFANRPVIQGGFNDPRLLHKFGNLTTTATAEVLVATRVYNEQSSQAQRSVKSTSVQDAAAGTGAKAVRITYLDSNYVVKTEDLSLNGTTAVPTVATDIRFIESFKVIQGAAAAGAIELWTTTGGTGTAIAGIAAATEDAFLCHHYVPAGYHAYILGWGVTVSDDVNAKLKGQVRYGANLVDVNLDLDNIAGTTAPLSAGGRASFYREFKGMELGEKTYVRITAVPQQTSSTVTRAILDLWEDKL
jgi:hypothetical protein